MLGDVDGDLLADAGDRGDRFGDEGRVRGHPDLEDARRGGPVGIRHRDGDRDDGIPRVRVLMTHHDVAFGRRDDRDGRRRVVFHGVREKEDVALVVDPGGKHRDRHGAAGRDARGRPLLHAGVDAAPLGCGVHVGSDDGEGDGRGWGNRDAVGDGVREGRRPALGRDADDRLLVVRREREGAEGSDRPELRHRLGGDRQHVPLVRVVVVQQQGQRDEVARAHPEGVGDRDRRLLLGDVVDLDGALVAVVLVFETPLRDRDEGSVGNAPQHPGCRLVEHRAVAVAADDRHGLVDVFEVRFRDLQRHFAAGCGVEQTRRRGEPGGDEFARDDGRGRGHAGRVGDELLDIARRDVDGDQPVTVGEVHPRRGDRRLLQHGRVGESEVEGFAAAGQPEQALLGVEQRPATVDESHREAGVGGRTGGDVDRVAELVAGGVVHPHGGLGRRVERDQAVLVDGDRVGDIGRRLLALLDLDVAERVDQDRQRHLVGIRNRAEVAAARLGAIRDPGPGLQHFAGSVRRRLATRDRRALVFGVGARGTQVSRVGGVDRPRPAETLREDESGIAVLHDARIVGSPHGVDLGEFGVDPRVLTGVARHPYRGRERGNLLRVVAVDDDREGSDDGDRRDPGDERNQPAKRAPRCGLDARRHLPTRHLEARHHRTPRANSATTPTTARTAAPTRPPMTAAFHGAAAFGGSTPSSSLRRAV